MLLKLTLRLSNSAPPRSRAARHATVDHQFRARHVAGCDGGEEENSVRDVLRLPSPAERYSGFGYFVRINRHVASGGYRQLRPNRAAWISPASAGETSDRDISGAPSSLCTPAASFVSAASACCTLPLRIHHADHASLSRAARSERVWRQACIISATIAACSSIGLRSGGSVLSPAATNTLRAAGLSRLPPPHPAL